jgi:hypothetical protein|tara:strand:+ start:3752 stop:4054 length:303 start_codon:yes stop_codon:yes gene_type:complete
MSLSGKLLRGLKWHRFRNIEGVYHEDIANHPHKMNEVNHYLAFVQERDAKKVHQILEKVVLHDLNGRELLRAEVAKRLESESLLLPKAKPKAKPKDEPKE